uniref:Uncharacterized protein n=1 Tax=Siphoviridae sp. ctRuT6 TaxID=2826339 RepID=A0A8S5N2N1_9CAUD|nr:MAG TPA: hypothetical protein [Siphoviridae sp. ctRuT6]
MRYVKIVLHAIAVEIQSIQAKLTYRSLKRTRFVSVMR